MALPVAEAILRQLAAGMRNQHPRFYWQVSPQLNCEAVVAAGRLAALCRPAERRTDGVGHRCDSSYRCNGRGGMAESNGLRTVSINYEKKNLVAGVRLECQAQPTSAHRPPALLAKPGRRLLGPFWFDCEEINAINWCLNFPSNYFARRRYDNRTREMPQ